MKRCLKAKDNPIALVTVDENGFPHIYTQHNPETLDKVWKHLASAPIVGNTTHFEDQEN